MIDLSSKDYQEVLAGEMLLFGLLGRILYTYPNKEERNWIQSLIDDDVFLDSPYAPDQKDIAAGVKLLSNWSKQGLSDEIYLDIQSDYTQLFIGPEEPKASPNESIYFSEDEVIFQEETLQVRAWFKRFGLETEKLYNEPDDHIGLEMSFIAFLAKNVLKAIDDGDLDKAKDLVEARNQFLSEHLLLWGPQWCELVIENARTDFYKGLAYVTLGAFRAITEQYDIDSP